MNPAIPSVVKAALYGVVLVSLAILLLLQLLSGTTYAPVKFRTSQPKAYWGIMAVYGAALMAVLAIFILWR
jgi:hypothetical protein